MPPVSRAVAAQKTYFANFDVDHELAGDINDIIGDIRQHILVTADMVLADVILARFGGRFPETAEFWHLLISLWVHLHWTGLLSDTWRGLKRRENYRTTTYQAVI